MVADEQLGKEYWPLYSLMRRAAAAPLLAFPDKEDESSLEVGQPCFTQHTICICWEHCPALCVTKIDRLLLGQYTCLLVKVCCDCGIA